MMQAYLDYNATAPVRPEVAAAMAEMLGRTGNPSSVHQAGRKARALLEEAKVLSPKGLDLLVNKDNFRAIQFYRKNGFIYAGEDKNPVSGLAVNRMSWRP